MAPACGRVERDMGRDQEVDRGRGGASRMVEEKLVGGFADPDCVHVHHACSANLVRSRAMASLSRDLTVPSGTPMRAAMSLCEMSS